MSKRIDVKDLNVYYGNFLAVEDVNINIDARSRDGVHRPLRLRQVHLPAHPEPDARGHSRRPRRGRGAAGRRQPLRPRRRPGRPCARQIGMVFQRPNPFPHDVDPRQRAGRRAAEQQADLQGRGRRPRGEVAARRQPVERGQGPAGQARLRASPAASSSACASPARSRSSRRCC